MTVPATRMPACRLPGRDLGTDLPNGEDSTVAILSLLISFVAFAAAAGSTIYVRRIALVERGRDQASRRRAISAVFEDYGGSYPCLEITNDGEEDLTNVVAEFCEPLIGYIPAISSLLTKDGSVRPRVGLGGLAPSETRRLRVLQDEPAPALTATPGGWVSRWSARICPQSGSAPGRRQTFSPLSGPSPGAWPFAEPLPRRHRAREPSTCCCSWLRPWIREGLASSLLVPDRARARRSRRCRTDHRSRVVVNRCCGVV
jgi:hypothetical protein